MSQEKVIFLDFDGVLNSAAYFKKNKGKSKSNKLGEAGAIDKDAVARINRLVEETGALVVVSSTWRQIYSLAGLQEFLNKRGATFQLWSITPSLRERRTDDMTGQRYEVDSERGNEIRKWLDDNYPDAKFVVFDDNADMTAVRNRFIQTDFDYGILDTHIDTAIKMLTEDDDK